MLGAVHSNPGEHFHLVLGEGILILHSFLVCLILSLPDVKNNSPYCLLYSSHDVSLANSVLNQLTIAQLMLLFILITYLPDIVLILK